MPTFKYRRFAVLALLAMTLVNPALLAQVSQPAESSRAAQVFTRRAVRRSRRIWLLVPAARMQISRQKAVAADRRGPAAADATDNSPVLPAAAFAPPPAPAENEAVPEDPAAAGFPACPRYLLYCTLQI